MHTVSVSVIILYRFYKRGLYQVFYNSMWVKKIIKEVRIYSQKVMQLKNWIINVDIIKYNLHTHAFINIKLYVNKEIVHVWLLHYMPQKIFQNFVGYPWASITALQWLGMGEINFSMYRIFLNISEEFWGDFTKIKLRVRLIYEYMPPQKKITS